MDGERLVLSEKRERAMRTIVKVWFAMVVFGAIVNGIVSVADSLTQAVDHRIEVINQNAAEEGVVLKQQYAEFPLSKNIEDRRVTR
jgi:hypothetical protein